jgi:transposase InsO family protein
MSAAPNPIQLVLLTLASWISRHQQDVIAYLVEENHVLKEQLKGKQLRLTDDQRRRLAAKAKKLGRRTLDGVATIVTPDTLMRWYRRLIAAKWTYEQPRVGRPGLMKAIKELIVRMARENAGWGYSRIQGELKAVGHLVARTTVANVLKANGIKPAPGRPSSWSAFLKAHWGQVAAMDFFTVEVWTALGLRTHYVLFVIDLKTRLAHVAGVTTAPGEEFVAQVARNLTDAIDGFLKSHKALILDRDTKFTAQFKRILEDSGVRVILTPCQAPNCNAYAERFVLSIKTEALERMVFFGEKALRSAVADYLAHYNSERAHQGIGNERLTAGTMGEGEVLCSERLGGLLNHYYRAA